jgi:carboxypeptidase Q
LKPRRTIRVVLFANEENGFDGANTYAALHKDEIHQLVSESDFGAGKIYRVASRVREAAIPAIDNIAKVLEPLGIAYATGNKGSPGPDAGVLMRARSWPAMGLSQDGINYFDFHHTDNDTLDKIDPATLPQNVAAWAVTAYLAAQANVAFGPIQL